MTITDYSGDDDTDQRDDGEDHFLFDKDKDDDGDDSDGDNDDDDGL